MIEANTEDWTEYFRPGSCAICSFRGGDHFLSNFYPFAVDYDGVTYLTVEHAYQAAKTPPVHRWRIQAAAHPSDAKRLGRKVPLRQDWEVVKNDVMKGLLRQKFSKAGLAMRLLETGTLVIIEGNNWGDRYWGVCEGSDGRHTGKNVLGLMLMEIREEMRKEPKMEKKKTILDEMRELQEKYPNADVQIDNDEWYMYSNDDEDGGKKLMSGGGPEDLLVRVLDAAGIRASHV